MPKATRAAVKSAKSTAASQGYPKRSTTSKVPVLATFKKKDGEWKQTGGASMKRLKNVSQRTFAKAARRGKSTDY